MKKYLTIHENKNELEKFWLKNLDASVRAINSIKEARIQSKEELFSLSTNDMIILKFGRKTIQEISELKSKYKPSSNPNDAVSNLDRFTNLSNGEMLEDLDGEYVLFSDVIKAVSILFSAQND